MSKLTSACYLFLFRHRFHVLCSFSVKSAKSVPKRNHQVYFDTPSSFFSLSVSEIQFVFRCIDIYRDWFATVNFLRQ